MFLFVWTWSWWFVLCQERSRSFFSLCSVHLYFSQHLLQSQESFEHLIYKLLFFYLFVFGYTLYIQNQLTCVALDDFRATHVHKLLFLKCFLSCVALWPCFSCKQYFSWKANSFMGWEVALKGKFLLSGEQILPLKSSPFERGSNWYCIKAPNSLSWICIHKSYSWIKFSWTSSMFSLTN